MQRTEIIFDNCNYVQRGATYPLTEPETTHGVCPKEEQMTLSNIQREGKTGARTLQLMPSAASVSAFSELPFKNFHDRKRSVKGCSAEDEHPCMDGSASIAEASHNNSDQMLHLERHISRDADQVSIQRSLKLFGIEFSRGAKRPLDRVELDGSCREMKQVALKQETISDLEEINMKSRGGQPYHGHRSEEQEKEESVCDNNYTIKRNRIYECNYCCKKFASSQALGGHQNAHKTERLRAKRLHMKPTINGDSQSVAGRHGKGLLYYHRHHQNYRMPSGIMAAAPHGMRFVTGRSPMHNALHLSTSVWNNINCPYAVGPATSFLKIFPGILHSDPCNFMGSNPSPLLWKGDYPQISFPLSLHAVEKSDSNLVEIGIRSGKVLRYSSTNSSADTHDNLNNIDGDLCLDLNLGRERTADKLTGS